VLLLQLGGLGISKLQFLIKVIVYSAVLFHFWSSKPGYGSTTRFFAKLVREDVALFYTNVPV
jgi:hypothetical protein